MGLQEEIADAVLLVRLYGVLVRLAQYGQGAVRYSAIAERRTSHWPVRSNPDILRGKNILQHYCMGLPPSGPQLSPLSFSPLALFTQSINATPHN